MAADTPLSAAMLFARAMASASDTVPEFAGLIFERSRAPEEVGCGSAKFV